MIRSEPIAVQPSFLVGGSDLGARQVTDEGRFMEFKPPVGAAAVAEADSRARIGVSESGALVHSPLYVLC